MASRLFNVTPAPASDIPPAAPQAAPAQTALITAGQSTITFAAAPALVKIVASVLGAVFPALANSKLIVLILSLMVGILIYLQSASLPTRREQILGFCFALINSFTIAATTLGIDAVINPSP